MYDNAKEKSLLYAKLDNRWVHISEVETGLQCNCKCPECNEQLIAKKGNIKKHHFAHMKFSTCNLDNNTPLLKLILSIIKNSTGFAFPEFDFYNIVGSSNINPHIHFDKTIIKPTNLYIDKKNNGIYIKNSEGKVTFLNIADKVSPKYHGAISKKHSILTLALSEDDLNTPIYRLKRIITERTDNKKWVFNKDADDYFANLLDGSNRLKIYHYKNNSSGQVFCPLKKENKLTEVGSICYGKPCPHYFMDDWIYLYCLSDKLSTLNKRNK